MTQSVDELYAPKAIPLDRFFASTTPSSFNAALLGLCLAPCVDSSGMRFWLPQFPHAPWTNLQN